MNVSKSQEITMYVISISTLVISLLLLGVLGFDSVNVVTGAAVYELGDGIITFDEESIDYDTISLDNITQSTVLNAILQAENDMEEMQAEGFGILWVNDTLREAKKHFEGENYTDLLVEVDKINDSGSRERTRALLLSAQEQIGVAVDYKKVLENTQAINDRKKRAYEINDLIRALELRINEFAQQGLDIFEVGVNLARVVDEFNNERYENVEELIDSIDSKLIELSAETTLGRTIYRAGRDNIITFLKDNYKILLVVLILIIVVGILIYNRVMIYILTNRIKDMEVEEEVLADLIKKAQSDYFEKTVITKNTFEIKTTQYQERMSEIKQKLPGIKSRLEKRLKFKRLI